MEPQSQGTPRQVAGTRKGAEEEDMDDPSLFNYDDLEIEEVMGDSSTGERTGERRFTITFPSSLPLEDIYGVTPNSPREAIPATFQNAFQGMNIIVEGALVPAQQTSALSPRSAPPTDSTPKSTPRADTRFSAIFSQAELEHISKIGKENADQTQEQAPSIAQLLIKEEDSSKSKKEMVQSHFGFVNDVTPKWALSLWLSQNADISPEIPFHEVLLAPDLILATALCRVVPVTESEEVAKALVRVFQRYDDSIRLIKVAVKREVAITESGNTLFRSNSMSCKLLSHFSRMIGSKYLEAVLKQHIQTICTRNINLEIDPYKLKDKHQVEANMKELKMWAQAFLDSIVCSINECPQPFRIICNHLRTEVSKRFPEKKYVAISSFIFLRFFCPAIVAPHAFGVLKKPPPDESQRTLVLISKVLQNLANGTEFGSKEPWMADMNTFIIENDTKMKEFCTLLANPISESITHTEVRYTITKPVFDQCMDHLATCIDKYLPQISLRVGKKRVMANVSYRTLDRLHASIQHSKKASQHKVRVNFPDPFPGMTVEPLANLVDMLFCPSNKILSILINQLYLVKGTPKFESAVKSLFKLYQSNGRLFHLLDIAARHEVERCTASQSVLTNSASQILLGICFSLEGKQYLKGLVAPIIQTIISSGQPFILDQNAGPEGNKHVQDMVDIFQDILQRIFSSHTDMPLVMKHAVRTLWIHALKKYGEEDCTVMTATFILNEFICACISSPETHGVSIEALPKSAKRGLAMVSKMLINMATKKQYREAYMNGFNLLMDTNVPKMKEFIVQIVNPPTDSDPLSFAHFGLGEIMGDAFSIFDFVAETYGEFIRVLEEDETDLTVSYNFIEVVSTSLHIYKTRVLEKQRRW